MEKYMDHTNSNFINNMLYSMQQQNLVYNCNFLYYSNKNIESSLVVYHHPDGWVYSDNDPKGSIGFDLNTNCCVITTGPDTKTMTFSQALHEFPRWESKLQGKTVTAKAVMNLSGLTGVEVKLSLDDGIRKNTNSVITNGDIELEVQIEVSNKAGSLKITLETSAPSATIKISKIYANVGTIAIENLPCIVKGVIGERKQYPATEYPPAEELSLCAAPAGLDSYSRLDSVINKKFGTTADGRFSVLPDLRGYFSRSWNNGSDVDPDAADRKASGHGSITGDHAGSVQEDTFLSHAHSLNFSSMPVSQGPAPPGTGLNLSATSDTNSTGGKETRPKNVSELYTIKWA